MEFTLSVVEGFRMTKRSLVQSVRQDRYMQIDYAIGRTVRVIL